MSRLQGKQPNTGAIIVGAVIFSLVAAGLFFAFRPVPEPTDAGLNNSAPPIESSAPESDESESNATTESENSLTTILTPLPEATPTSEPTSKPTSEPASEPTLVPEPKATTTLGAAATPKDAPPISGESAIKPEATAPVR